MSDSTHEHLRSGLAWIATEIDTRQIDQAERVIRGVTASDESLDSHGSVILSGGWDLARYNANPVMLWNHTSREGNPDDVLGTAPAAVESGRLVADLHFEDGDTNPLAEKVWKKITGKRRSIKGLSVGFRPTSYHFEKRGEGQEEILVIDGAELAEISIVPIPSNVNTLIQLRSMCPRPCECTHTQEGAMPADEKTAAVVEPMPVVEPQPEPVVEPPAPDPAVRMAELDLALSNAQRDLAAAQEDRDVAIAQRDALAKQIAERAEKDAAEEVDALVKAGRLPAEKRDAALLLYKANRDAFVQLYPRQAAFPLADTLTRKESVLPPAKQSAPKPMGNPIQIRIDALRAEDPKLNYVDAASRALNELERGQLDSNGNVIKPAV